MLRKIFLLIALLALPAINPLLAYWQQEVKYEMDIHLNVKNHQFTGKQKLTYYNNSPDTLHSVYYHLYFNAFQPNSGMDYRSRWLPDPDKRVGDRIQHLKPNEIGYQQVNALLQNGKAVKYIVQGTLLIVPLNNPILPGDSCLFEMDFTAQVPVQIRRSGRDSEDNVAYSMTQWYPKMAAYDRNGWHAHPYLGREFHGNFGSFLVRITLDPRFIVGGTGVLQNPEAVGGGYIPEEMVTRTGTNPKMDKTWIFLAENVHDFAWAADPDYAHDIIYPHTGLAVHFLYKKDGKNIQLWKELQEYIPPFFEEMKRWFGEYPYPVFSFIEGGDGGMEYPMATLITNRGNLRGLVNVSYHEAIHNWFYGFLAFNESFHPWMDEGFTHFATNLMMALLFDKKQEGLAQESNYSAYYQLTRAEDRQPLSTHADWYNRNRDYSISAYAAGAVFLHQLRYVIGEETWRRGMLRFYNEWKFKHPEPIDFIRVMEKESRLHLWWYLNEFVFGLNKIMYTVDVKEEKGKTLISLERNGKFPMPIDVWIILKNGNREAYTIPLDVMYGNKQEKFDGITLQPLPPWEWVRINYQFEVSHKTRDIETVLIDGTGRLANQSQRSSWQPSATRDTKTK
jgi:hypothetical protein